MPKVFFAGLKKPSSIAKTLKKQFDVKSLSEAKEITASLSGYSDWVHLKRECESALSDEDVPKEMPNAQVEDTATKLKKMFTHLTERDARFFVAVNFPYTPIHAKDLDYFFSEDDIKSFNLSNLIYTTDADKNTSETEKQSTLDIVMELTQGIWGKKPCHQHAALYWHLAENFNCARAQVHLGRMLSHGNLGFVDNPSAYRMMLKGLPYRSELMFLEGPDVSLSDMSVSDMRAEIPGEWLCCAKAMLNSNEYNDLSFTPTLVSTVDSGLSYMDKLPTERQELKVIAGLNFIRAQAIAMGICLAQDNPSELSINDVIESLTKAGDLGDQHAASISGRLFTYYHDLQQQRESLCPVDTESELLYFFLSELIGAFLPHQRLFVAKVLLDNVSGNTALYRASPAIKETALELLQRIDSDIARWPHLEDDFLSAANLIMVEFLEKEILVDEVIEIGMTLSRYGDPVIIQNTVMALKSHASEKAVIEIGAKLQDMAILDPQDERHPYNIMDHVQALILETRIGQAFHGNMSANELFDAFKSFKEECDELADKNFLFPAFRVIYAMREQLRATDIEPVMAWATELYQKVSAANYIPHPHDEDTSVDRIIMEYGVLKLLSGDKKEAIKALKKAAVNYPDAHDALIMAMHVQ